MMMEEDHAEASAEEKSWGFHEVEEESSAEGGSTGEGTNEPATVEGEPQEKSIIELEREYWEKKIKLIDIITEKVTGNKPEEKLGEKS